MPNTDTNKCNSVNDSTILQDDDDCVFANNSKYDIVIPKGTSFYVCTCHGQYFKTLTKLNEHYSDCGEIQFQWAQHKAGGSYEL